MLDKEKIFKRQIREDEEEAAAEEKKLCNLVSAPHIYSLMGWLSDFVSHWELNSKSAEEAMSALSNMQTHTHPSTETLIDEEVERAFNE